MSTWRSHDSHAGHGIILDQFRTALFSLFGGEIAAYEDVALTLMLDVP